jgi:hypothetical protein
MRIAWNEIRLLGIVWDRGTRERLILELHRRTQLPVLESYDDGETCKAEGQSADSDTTRPKVVWTKAGQIVLQHCDLLELCNG